MNKGLPLSLVAKFRSPKTPLCFRNVRNRPLKERLAVLKNSLLSRMLQKMRIKYIIDRFVSLHFEHVFSLKRVEKRIHSQYLNNWQYTMSTFTPGTEVQEMELDPSNLTIRLQGSINTEDEFVGIRQLELLDRVEDILSKSAVCWPGWLDIRSDHHSGV